MTTRLLDAWFLMAPTSGVHQAVLHLGFDQNRLGTVFIVCGPRVPVSVCFSKFISLKQHWETVHVILHEAGSLKDALTIDMGSATNQCEGI